MGLRSFRLEMIHSTANSTMPDVYFPDWRSRLRVRAAWSASAGTSYTHEGWSTSTQAGKHATQCGAQLPVIPPSLQELPQLGCTFAHAVTLSTSPYRHGPGPCQLLPGSAGVLIVKLRERFG